MAKGMGFRAASSSIMRKGGYGRATANRILAASSRNASRKAKRANPNLRKVSRGKSGR